MSSEEPTPFPNRTLKRYAELVLRHIHQSGGRARYVAVDAIEDALGLEEALILELCRTRLRGEVHLAQRLPADLEESVDCRTPVEREVMRLCFSRPHVRIRPAAVRLTAEELLRKGRRRRKRCEE
jgi:hypothetical protein